MAILTGRDYETRDALLSALHDRSVRHIGAGDVVVSGGLSDFDPAGDARFHDVFERADQRMYREKQALKEMGAVTRD